MAGRNQTWRNRIVEHEDVAPDQLLASPFNFRRHPKEQQAALAGILDEVGWIQNVIVNRTTGHMIDGHLRVELALRHDAPTVPVTYVELSEEDEKKALLTFDPLTAMAYHDAEQLRALLDEVSTADAAVMAMLSNLAEQEGIIPPDRFDPNAEWQGMPEFHQDDLMPVKQITVSFYTADDMAVFAELVGQKITMQTKGIAYPPTTRLPMKSEGYADGA